MLISKYIGWYVIEVLSNNYSGTLISHDLLYGIMKFYSLVKT